MQKTGFSQRGSLCDDAYTAVVRMCFVQGNAPVTRAKTPAVYIHKNPVACIFDRSEAIVLSVSKYVYTKTTRVSKDLI